MCTCQASGQIATFGTQSDLSARTNYFRETFYYDEYSEAEEMG